jgi:DNA-directed RNA polymerase specialized sigma24 family protein
MDTIPSVTSDTCSSGSFATPFSRSDLQILLHEADVAARRLVRRLRLPVHEREDLRQDLLTDLIARLAAFDPARGTLAAFAGAIIEHRATRLSERLRRHRAVFAPVSLDDPVVDAEGTTLGETIAESGGYPAMMGQPADGFAAVERRLDVERAFGTLSRSDLDLCSHLTHRTPTELSQKGFGARATLYRQVQEIRLQLMTAGLSAAA